ncbi:MAG: ABC transporter permease [Oscillospiraceae bacterium]|nr:ABC transporter permease [Oscillospiraceae bacterium]
MHYAIRKLITLLITLFAISLLAFLAFAVIPGDPAVLQLGVHATPESIEALRIEMGLDQPVLVRYAQWLGDMLFGDMGRSFDHGVSVRELLGDRLAITGSLMTMSFLFTLAIALPIGLLTARRPAGTKRNRHRAMQGTVTGLTQIMMAASPLFLGLVLTFVFGVTLRWFVPSAFVSFRDSTGGFLWYMLFPALAIALPKAAMTVRLIRTSVAEEYAKDYILTAISRGNGPRAILYRHVLPNIAVPVITFSALTLIMMMTDSIVVEQVFSIPGAGRLLISAIRGRDYPVVQALVVVIAAVVMVTHTVSDILARAIDRRITL